MASALDPIVALSAFAVHRRAIVPYVRRELGRWIALAGAIPDPVLREAALSTLREKGSNAETTAVFAILTPRKQRAQALRAMTALQTMVDYLDTLGEQPVGRPLENGQTLHRALIDAVSPPCAERSDWYRLHPQDDGGGYLAGLVGACQQEIAALPAAASVGPPIRQAALRCGEGQSRTHAAALGATEELHAWASRQDCPPCYRWWEVAAGASSSVAIHALIAAAADPRTTAEEAELVGAAYFPPIGALTVLLDDLVDLEEDAANHEHNYIAYYSSDAVAANRIAFVAQRAGTAVTKLRHRRRHAAILAGVIGFYLSAPSASGELAAPIGTPVLESSKATVRLVRAILRFQRRG